MHRRHFIALTTAAATGIALPQAADAFADLRYDPATWDMLKGSDDTVVLFFRASWSLTCQIKQDIIANLIAGNPAYDGLTFVDVNWDTYGPSEMAKSLKIPRRSTLVVMKGGREIARLVNEPHPRKIRALLETALTA